MRTRVCKLLLLIACPAAAATCTAQQSTHPDALALLQKVAQTYAPAPKSYRLESTEIRTNRNRFENSVYTTQQTILSAPDNAYRVTTMSGMGSTLSVSDGKTVHVLQLESNVYVEHPASKPGSPNTQDFYATSIPWKQVLSDLHQKATLFRRARYIGEETLILGSHHFRCYIVRAGKDDQKSGTTVNPEYRYTDTFWIDKQSFVFRKIVDVEHSAFIQTVDVHIPFDGRTETTYPVVDFAPHVDQASFVFTPPPGARLVPALMHTAGGEQNSILIGKPAPNITLISASEHTSLSSFRGKPVLIDFWATWCGPCTAAMPAMATLQHDFTAHGGVFFSIDQDNPAKNATDYLKQHHYDWQNFNDVDSNLSNAFRVEGVPDVILMDSTGKVVYDEMGGDEASLRRAITKLGPEFQALAPPAPKLCNCATSTAANNRENTEDRQ